MDEIQPEETTQVDAAGATPAVDNANLPKRQRRPSVRLGEIGDQPAATFFHETLRRPRHWKASAGKSSSSSKTRPLAKLNAGTYQEEENTETLGFMEEENRDSDFDNVAIGSWKTKDSKSKRAVKKPRTTNWMPKIDEGVRNAVGDEKSEELGLGGSQLGRSHNSSSRVRVEEEEEEVEEEEEEREIYHNGGGGEAELETERSEDGVKNWLEGLGLRRYWPVFEIHEVDEEVLPSLTLEDLKDMGINAVGSRRKMFGAIQKLRKGFS